MNEQRLAKVLTAIMELAEAKHYPPSTREIGSACGYATTSAVHLWVSRLEASGFIQREKKTSRTIRVTPKGKRWIRSKAAQA